jgi:putative ABC transport system permease protein
MLNTSPLAIAWTQLRRDWRAGELRLLVLATLLAVAALSSVGFFADRLERGLARDARALLGGDAVVASDQPLPEAFAQQAQRLGLRSASNVGFPSMARAPEALGGAARLVALKAVTAGYPLRGQLGVRRAPDGPQENLAEGPQPGRVWVDAALLDALGLAVGDPLELGDATLRVDAILIVEPDRGAGFLSFAPRVLMHADDLPRTALLQPASRVTHRLAVAAAGERDTAAVTRFVVFAEDQLRSGKVRGARLESLEAGRPEMRQTLERASRFLSLVALLAALLAAVAVAIAARDFALRHLDDCAMLRVLGRSQRAIATAYTLEFALVGLLASLAGLALGLLVHLGFVWLLSGLVNANLPPPGLAPALFGLGVGMTLLAAFGLPPVLQLARVPPLRMIRREVGTPKPATLAVVAMALAGFVALLMVVAADLKMGAVTVGGFALAAALFSSLAWVAVVLLRRLVPESTAPRWLVLATRQVASRPAYAVLQVAALSVGLMALLLLVLLRTDLVESWRKASPPDAPNRFVLNVQPDQGPAFRQHLEQAGVTSFDWFPMVRGRLVSINGQAVQAERLADARAQRLAEREFNLSYSAQEPAHNRVVAGRWQAGEDGTLSVEEGLAKTFGLKLGDSLGFDIAGQVVQGRISSLRQVDWGSMRVNFFVIFPRDLDPAVPASYLAAFRAPAQPGFDNALVRAFPNLTNVDVTASVAQVQRVLDQVIRAVEFLFGFTLAAGLVVLFAAVTATRQMREREFAVMRAMGASRQLLVQVQRAELLGVGALAGLLASLAALAVGWALAAYVFEFNWTAPLWVPLAGSAAGAMLALAAGWWGLREVLRRPVVQTLRQAMTP